MPQFEVIAVRHEDGDRSKIIKYRIKDLTSIWASPISDMERFDLLIRLNAGITFGVRENPTDNDLIPVIRENINGHEYIKTIANNIPADNLGNLPEF
jgi:hypothetical protein